MKETVQYVVKIGLYQRASVDKLEDALRIYEDAKENNSDYFLTLSKVTTEILQEEYIE